VSFKIYFKKQKHDRKKLYLNIRLPAIPSGSREILAVVRSRNEDIIDPNFFLCCKYQIQGIGINISDITVVDSDPK